MTIRLALGRPLAELQSLPDDALLGTREAAAFLKLSPQLAELVQVQLHPAGLREDGHQTVRYRVGALSAYADSQRPGIGRPKTEG